MTTRVLLTGATGHAGASLAEKIIAQTDWEVLALERLPLYGVFDRKAHLPAERIHKVYHDFRAPLPDAMLGELAGVDYIIHAGAEVHGPRSLVNPGLFVQSNVIGTFNMLEAARKLKPKTFLYVSSAEAIGPAPEGGYSDEDATLRPTNPYAAAKAAGEMLVLAYHRSFGVPALTVRTMNLFGERQQSEKFIPTVFRHLIADKTIPVHVGPDGKSGTRQWLYVGFLSEALLYLLTKGVAGQTYHVAGEEKTNTEIVALLSDYLGVVAKMDLVDVSIHHPAHTLRYAMSSRRLQKLGWRPSSTFAVALLHTMRWMFANQDWLEL